MLPELIHATWTWKQREHCHCARKEKTNLADSVSARFGVCRACCWHKQGLLTMVRMAPCLDHAVWSLWICGSAASTWNSLVQHYPSSLRHSVELVHSADLCAKPQVSQPPLHSGHLALWWRWRLWRWCRWTQRLLQKRKANLLWRLVHLWQWKLCAKDLHLWWGQRLLG